MTALAGPFLIACAILGAGGAAKLITPAPAQRAVQTLLVAARRSPTVPLWTVRLLGAGELALATAAALQGGPALPALVAIAYGCFALFVVAMLNSGAGTSCGCFGSSATPPSRLHVVLNVALAGVALGSIGAPSLGDVLGDQPWAGIPLLGLSTLGSYLVLLVFIELPRLSAPPQPNVAAFSLAASTRHRARS